MAEEQEAAADVLTTECVCFDWFDAAVTLPWAFVDITIFKIFFELLLPSLPPSASRLFVVLLVLCSWYWLLDLWMPIYKLCNKQGYYHWLGDPDWRAPCVTDLLQCCVGGGQENGGVQDLLRPKTALIVNFLWSHIGLTIYAAMWPMDDMEANDDSAFLPIPTDMVLILKIVFAVLKAIKACREISYDLEKAQQMFQQPTRPAAAT